MVCFFVCYSGRSSSKELSPTNPRKYVHGRTMKTYSPVQIFFFLKPTSRCIARVQRPGTTGGRVLHLVSSFPLLSSSPLPVLFSPPTFTLSGCSSPHSRWSLSPLPSLPWSLPTDTSLACPSTARRTTVVPQVTRAAQCATSTPCLPSPAPGTATLLVDLVLAQSPEARRRHPVAPSSSTGLVEEEYQYVYPILRTTTSGLTSFLSQWPHEVGPVMTYMASCNGPCSKFNAAGAQWFKIGQSGKSGSSWPEHAGISTSFLLHPFSRSTCSSSLLYRERPTILRQDPIRSRVWGVSHP